MPKNGQKPYWLPAKEALKKIQDSNAEPRNILILGAGIAGLTAAYELGKLYKKKNYTDHKIHLVEASKRVGGRVWTHRFGEEPREGEEDKRPYHELGAMRIPELTHDYTWHYLHEMGLKTREFFNDDRNKKGYYDIKGNVFRRDEANKMFVQLFPGMNDLEKDKVLSDGPGGLLKKYLTPIKWELEAKGLVSKLVNGHMDHSYLRWIDHQSLRTYLLGLVEEEEMTQDALELIGKALSFESLWGWSLAEFLRGDYTNTAGGSRKLFEVIDGLDLLPKTIHKKIEDDLVGFVEIHMEVEAKEIHLAHDGSVRVTLFDRKGKKPYGDLLYEQVLCTIPFPVMRLMTLTGISLPKIRAIRNMEYSSSAKVLLLCKQRFWEKEGIFGGRSISDRLSRQTYYPSNFSWNTPQTPDLIEPEKLFENLGQEFESVHMHTSNTPRETLRTFDSKEDLSKGVLLGSYSWTDNARQIGKLKKEESAPATSPSERNEISDRAKKVMEDIQYFHEDISDQVEASVSIYWDEYPWSRGAFAITPPGDLTAYYQDGRRAEGRLFFAGEHISIAPGWIQGALESSLAALSEMLQKDIS